MVPLGITLDTNKGVTVLSNVFIDQYMREANDAQIKIYLYLLRMVAANLPTNISEIADKFNHTEKDVVRALKYWENAHLLTLSRDETGQITGVIIRDLTNNDSPVIKTTPAEDPVKEDITMISMDYMAEKENYSMDDIAKLQSNPEVTLLLNIASQYFARPLSPNEIRSILFIYDRLAFSLELTDFLIEYCLDKGKKSIHYIDQVAINWFEAGIKSVDAAKEFTKDNKADKLAYTIMKWLGKSNEPTLQELEYIKKWTRTYAFSSSIIEEACTRTVMSTDKNRFQYADSILKNWMQKNVHKLSDIETLDAEYKASKNAKQTDFVQNNIKSVNITANKGSFCKIEEQDYDFAALERAGRK